MIQMSRHIWCLNGRDPRYFLIVGEKRALVVDTGYGEEDIKALARTVTDVPLLLVNTHRHLDHVTGDGQFEEVYAHPAEFEDIAVFNPRCVPVGEGFVFRLGGVSAEVIETPGHTPGAICLLCPEDRVLLIGDNASDATIYMHNPYSDPAALADSLEKLLARASEYDTVLCCHGTCPTDLDTMRRVIALGRGTLAGELRGRTVERNFRRGRQTVLLYERDGVSFYRPC